MADSGSGAPTDWESIFAEQAHEHGRLFFRVANDIVRDADIADEVCQQAFLKAWERRSQLREAASLRSWLTRTVVNEAIHTVRRQTIERRVLGELALNAVPPEEMQGVDHPVAIKESVAAALVALPEQTRLVVVLRVMQKVPGKTVKHLLGISDVEVTRTMKKGLKILKPLLADWADEVH